MYFLDREFTRIFDSIESCDSACVIWTRNLSHYEADVDDVLHPIRLNASPGAPYWL